MEDGAFGGAACRCSLFLRTPTEEKETQRDEGDGSQGDQDVRVNSDQSDVTLVGDFFSFYIPLHLLSFSPTVASAIPLFFSVQFLFRRLSRHTIRR